MVASTNLLIRATAADATIRCMSAVTTQLVDEAASHLRLYRTALSKTKENLNSDLISVFFDVEAAMEKNLCRDMVCTDDAHLEGTC